MASSLPNGFESAPFNASSDSISGLPDAMLVESSLNGSSSAIGGTGAGEAPGNGDRVLEPTIAGGGGVRVPEPAEKPGCAA